MSSSCLTINVAHLDGVATIFLEGELDYFETDDLRAQLLPPAARTITLDLSKLDFIDAAGVSALIAVGHATEEAGANLRIVNAPRHIRRVFELTAAAYLLAA